VLVLFLEPAGLPRFLTMTRRKGVNLTKKGVNLKFSKTYYNNPSSQKYTEHIEYDGKVCSF
jgi:hypothetical protein